MQPSQPVRPSSSPKARSKRWLRRIGMVAGVFGLVIALGTLAAHLWLDDARLTAMANRLAVAALPSVRPSLGTVHRDGWHSLVITDVRLGPPAGFSQDILRIASVRLRWHFTPLLRRELLLEEVRVSGVTCTLERNALGSNLDTLLGAPSSSHGFSPPQMPLRVVARAVHVDVSTVSILTGDNKISLTALQFDAVIDASSDALSLAATLRLGGEAKGAPSHLEIWRAAKPIASVAQSAQLTAVAKDWGQGKLVLHAAGEAKLAGAHKAVLPLSVDGEVTYDLQRGEAALQHCSLSLGEAVQAQAAFKASDIFAGPTLQIDKLQAHAQLALLSPWLHVWQPGMSLQGTVDANVSPLSLALQNAGTMPPVEITVAFADVDIGATDLQVQGAFGTALVSQRGARLALCAAGRVRSLQHGDSYAEGARAAMWLDAATDAGVLTPDTPWQLNVHAAVNAAHNGDAQAEDMRLHIYTEAPWSWLHGAPSRPLQLDSNFTWSRVQTPAVRLEHGKIAATAAIAGVDAAHLQGAASIDVVRSVRTPPGAAPQVFPALHAAAQARRDNDTFVVDHARLRLGEVNIAADGRCEHAFAVAPRVDLHIMLPQTQLPALMAMTPPPQQALTGTVQADIRLAGLMPYAELLAQASLPEAADWNTQLQAYALWLRSWAQRFDAGFPFVLHGQVDARDVAFAGTTFSAAGLRLQASADIDAQGPQLRAHLSMPEAAAPTPAPMRGVDATLALGYDQGVVQSRAQLRIDRAQMAQQTTALEGIALDFNARYAIDADAHIDTLDLHIVNRGLSLHADGVVQAPLAALATRAWLLPQLGGTRGAAHVRFALNTPTPQTFPAGITLAGAMQAAGDVSVGDGLIRSSGMLRFEDFSAQRGDLSVSHVDGELPAKVYLRAGVDDDAVPIAQGLGWGGGTLSLVSDAEDIRNRPARPVYYDRLRPYRQDRGVRARHAQSGPYEVTDIALEGRIDNGMLLADWVGMSLLGGDVAGNMALQLGRDSTLRGDVTFKASHIDASYFPALHLLPGRESELSADTHLSFLLGNMRRDLTTNVNVTRIGADALDRFLQLLDPEQENPDMGKARDNLHWVRIRNVAMWVRFENLNLDLEYDPLVGIPGTGIGWFPIERELVRRFSLSDILDTYQPMVDNALGPLLGWKHAS